MQSYSQLKYSSERHHRNRIERCDNNKNGKSCSKAGSWSSMPQVAIGAIACTILMDRTWNIGSSGCLLLPLARSFCDNKMVGACDAKQAAKKITATILPQLADLHPTQKLLIVPKQLLSCVSGRGIETTDSYTLDAAMSHGL